jgi:hypothetical protein
MLTDGELLRGVGNEVVAEVRARGQANEPCAERSSLVHPAACMRATRVRTAQEADEHAIVSGAAHVALHVLALLHLPCRHGHTHVAVRVSAS